MQSTIMQIANALIARY